MTNITLSIRDETYKKMKEYSEIKWSEFVRKAIEKRIEELESIEDTNDIMALMEDQLLKDWDNELDERWNYV